MPFKRIFVGRIKFKYFGRVGKIKVVKHGSKVKVKDKNSGQ